MRTLTPQETQAAAGGTFCQGSLSTSFLKCLSLFKSRCDGGHKPSRHHGGCDSDAGTGTDTGGSTDTPIEIG